MRTVVKYLASYMLNEQLGIQKRKESNISISATPSMHVTLVRIKPVEVI